MRELAGELVQLNVSVIAKIEGGQLVVSDKPGLSLAFDHAAFKCFQIG